jgi:integrase
MIYCHGLRVSEACDLRWDDIDLAARTIVIRRLKGSRDSTHYLERDELAGLRRLPRKGAYVFVNERGQPFGRMGIAPGWSNELAKRQGFPSPFTFTCFAIPAATPWRTRGWIREGFSTTSGTPQSRTQ